MRQAGAALLLISLPAAVAAATGPALSVDAAAARHPISPLIYGINDYSDQGLAHQLHIGVKRWGGDAATRYNWKNDTYNSASDYYFENYPYDDADVSVLPNGSAFDRFVEDNLRTGTVSIGTVPMLDWLPKGRGHACGYSVVKYGPQQKTNPYDADCGNGIKPDGKTHITNNDPADTSMRVDETFAQAWLDHLTTKYGRGARGGVQIWNLDNEPEWWFGVHMDIHPQPATYDEMLARGIRYGAVVKAVDPTALITGPVAAGWCGYFYSATDFVSGWSTFPYKCGDNPIDRMAHGNVAFVEWYLQQMRDYEQQHGARLLDYVDVHAYIAPDGISFGKAGDPAMDQLRLTSTRLFWDPNYTHGNSDITEAPRLVPRMREWVNNNYPGTRTAITEYNWGALDDITGAIAQADILGIFGREALDLGALWGPPAPVQPGAYAFRMFLNYDGAGGRFGDTSVAASTGDPDQLSIFAAQRSDNTLTILVLNKTTTDLSSSVAIANFQLPAAAQVYRYSAANLNAVVQQPDAPIGGGAIPAIFPARSLTLFVVHAPASGPVPAIAAVANAASYDAHAIAPGEIVYIAGKNLGPAQLQTATLTPDRGYIANSLAGARVLFDGIASPLVYVSEHAVAAVVPYEAALAATAHVQVEYQGVRSDAFTVPVTAIAPALFTIDSSGGGPGAILNADHTVNSAINPAARGAVVSIYGTGEGITNPPGVDGRVALDLLPVPAQPCTVNIGGHSAEVLYCGAAGGATAGLLQVNARVPDGVEPGPAVPVTIAIGGTPSQSGVTIAIE